MTTSGRLYGNFSYRELNRSSTAARNGIDNTAPGYAIANAVALIENCLQPIRDHYGIPFSPNSWYRCEKLEKIITHRSFYRWMDRKGYSKTMIHAVDEAWIEYYHKKSHPRGEAADIEIPGISNDDLFTWCKDNLTFDQLIRECAKPGDPMSGWVHISYKTDNNRNQAFKL